MPKNVQITIQLCSLHILARLCSKSFKLSLLKYMNWKLPDIQARFRKSRGNRDQIADTHWIMEKARKFQKKKSISASLTLLKLLIVWTTTNRGKLLKRWDYQTTLPISWQTCTKVKGQQLELDMEQQTGSKLRK